MNTLADFNFKILEKAIEISECDYIDSVTLHFKSAIKEPAKFSTIFVNKKAWDVWYGDADRLFNIPCEDGNKCIQSQEDLDKIIDKIMGLVVKDPVCKKLNFADKESIKIDTNSFYIIGHELIFKIYIR